VEMNIIHLGLIALFSMSLVSGMVASIQSTRNYIGKIIVAVILIIITFGAWILISDSWIFQYTDFDESLYSFPGTLALAVGGCCGYFVSTSHKYI
jgi:uncharacterized membrane protein YdbT with pleckstrin-like domain